MPATRRVLRCRAALHSSAARTARRSLLVLGICLAAVGTARAEGAPVPASRTGAAIHVDGRLDEEAWQGEPSVSRFYDNEPGDAEPPPVETRVWIRFDEEYLYVAIRAHDPRPDRIRASYTRRDGLDETDDSVSIFLDTIGDRRSAFEFRVNPRGSRSDGLWDETLFARDLAPDFFFDVSARVTSRGWSAELAIPFSTLRYAGTSPDSWGLLVRRNYPRDFRYRIGSSPVPRGSNCLLCHMRPIRGLEDLPETWHLVVAPRTAVSGGWERDAAGDWGVQSTDVEPGADAKWVPAPNHAIDVTLFPDFLEVESDVAQIEINERFALFFPEQRPFFLEGSDLYSTPIEAVDTRSITDPRAGLRATGRVGPTTYTVLAAQDQGEGSVILPGPFSSTLAEQDFESFDAIARLRHALGSSYMGFLFTDREIFEDADGHNRVLGPDLLWRPGQNNIVTAQYLFSDTREPTRPDITPEWDGEGLSDHAFDLRWQYVARRVEGSARYRDVGSDFRADHGFLPQVGVRESSGSLGYKFYPERVVHKVQPRVNGSYTTDRSGSVVSWFAVPGIEVFGARNSIGILELNHGAVRAGPEVIERTNVFFFLQADPSRYLTRVNVNGNFGEAIDFENGREGEGGRVSVGATLEPTDRLELEGLWNMEWLDVDDQAGRRQRLFTAQTLRLEARYSFSDRLFLRLIGEYVRTRRDPALFDFPVERRSGGLDGSVLLTYEIDWQTRVDVGYEEQQTLLPEGSLRERERTIFLKASYAFQL